MSDREVNLDGGEISVIKAIGLGGGGISGATLIERCTDLLEPELIDTLKSLMAIGYVEAEREAFYKLEEVEANHFNVNSGYMKDIKGALNPQEERPKSKRVRRE